MKTTLFFLAVATNAIASDGMRRVGFFSGDTRQVEWELKQEQIRYWQTTNTLTPWRVVGGTTNFIPASTNWVRLRGKVEQVGPSWVLVSGQAGNERGLLTNTLFLVKNLPFQPALGESMPDEVVARPLVAGSFRSSAGQARVALILDHGSPCQPQALGNVAMPLPGKALK